MERGLDRLHLSLASALKPSGLSFHRYYQKGNGVYCRNYWWDSMNVDVPTLPFFGSAILASAPLLAPSWPFPTLKVVALFS